MKLATKASALLAGQPSVIPPASGDIDPTTSTSAPHVLQQLEQTPAGREILEGLDAFIQTYGYLSEVNTDVAVPTWRERPETVHHLFANFVTLPRRAEAPREGPATAWQRWRVDRVEPRARLNSQIARVYARLMSHLRWTLVALERRWLKTGFLEAEGDIFFLEITEVERLVHSPTSFDPRPLVQTRRQQYEKDRHLAVPEVVYGSVFHLEEDPSATMTSLLKGIAASRGVAECTVKVATTLIDGYDVDKDIALVVPFADAGWAPLLIRAGALISEVGGQLSHGAIIAPEYGLPAVVNATHATQVLKNGQRVRVDGARGTVEIVS
jgi:phosphohistidine swiveling domain-containing protein